MSEDLSLLRVATWNLWWRFGEWEERRHRILKVLAGLGADVIGLQEVWSTRDGDFANEIADSLGFHHPFARFSTSDRWQKRIGDSSVDVGVAVVSRWPIEQVRIVRLPAGDAPDEGRVAIVCHVGTPFGGLPFATAHLNPGWAQSSVRAAQLLTVGRELLKAAHDAFPPVLCGDFNAGEDFDEIRALSGKRDPLVPELDLTDAWAVARPGESGFTWDRANPLVDLRHALSSRLDYVFVGFPDASLRGRPVASERFGTEPVEGGFSSDHFGVAVDLEIGAVRAPGDS